MFADDMNIVSYGFGSLDLAIDTCEKWAVNNDMTINKKKSKILININLNWHKSNSRKTTSIEPIRNTMIISRNSLNLTTR